jgi:hypothetical protein
VLENRVFFHILHKLVLIELLTEREDCSEYFLEAAQGVYWSSFTLWGLEEVFGSWI